MAKKLLMNKSVGKVNSQVFTFLRYELFLMNIIKL